MDETEPTMTNLFLQLGLDADDAAIARFIGAHQLAAGTHLADASFWNDGQRQFLSEQYGHVLREFARAIAQSPALPLISWCSTTTRRRRSPPRRWRRTCSRASRRAASSR